MCERPVQYLRAPSALLTGSWGFVWFCPAENPPILASPATRPRVIARTRERKGGRTFYLWAPSPSPASVPLTQSRKVRKLSLPGSLTHSTGHGQSATELIIVRAKDSPAYSSHCSRVFLYLQSWALGPPYVGYAAVTGTKVK